VLAKRTELVAAVLLVAVAVHAWEPVGPSGAPVIRGAASASDPRTMYVITYSDHRSSLLKTTNRGVEWSNARDSLPFVERAIVVDPADANILYAVCNTVHRSTDGGGSWAGLSAPAGMWWALCTDPARPHVLLIAGSSPAGGGDRAAYARSTDHGETWQLGWCDTARASYCYSILVDPSDTNTIYCGGYIGGRVVVYKTTDGGASWTSHDVGVGDRWTEPDGDAADGYDFDTPGQRCPGALLVSSSSPSIVLVGTPGAGLYRSTDGGIHWARHTLWALDTIYALAAAPGTPEVIYAGNGYNVLHSTNGGADWEGPWSGFSGGRNRCVIVPADSSGVVFCGNAYGFFRGSAPGRYWSMLHVFQSGIVRAVAFSGSGQTTAYAGVADNGVFRSRDSGGTWRQCAHFPDDGSIRGIASPSPSVLWAVTSRDSGRARVVFSADSGSHWQVADTLLEKGGAIAVPRQGFVVVVGSSRDSVGQDRFGVTISTNGGQSWRRSLLCSYSSGRSVAVNPMVSDWILAAGDSAGVGVIYSTRDTGRSWQRLDSGVVGSVNSVLFCPWSGGPLVCGTTQGVYWSANSGRSWSYSGLAQVRAVVADWYGRTAFAATRSGVFLSDVASGQWYDFNSGLLNPDVLCLATSSDSNGHQVPALAGTNGSGLFHDWVYHVGMNEDPVGPSPGKRGLEVSPNPFRGRTTVSLSAPGPALASIGVFDPSGRQVAGLGSSSSSAGTWSRRWDARGLPAGTYFIRAARGGTAYICRAVLLK
jgi:photosystem II stability/assembly factor-like uncharacterized protein